MGVARRRMRQARATGTVPWVLLSGLLVLIAIAPPVGTGPRALWIAASGEGRTGAAAAGNVLIVYVLTPSNNPVAWSRLVIATIGEIDPPANGSVQFYLPLGTYAVSAFAIGFASSHGNVTVSGSAPAAYTATLRQLPLSELFPLTFDLENRSNSAPIAGAKVVVAGLDLGVTSSSGYLLAPLSWPNATYAANFSAPGFEWNDTPVTVQGATSLSVFLNSTYTGAPAPGTCAGSFYPAGAALTIDQVAVPGTPNAQGGESFSVLLSPGTHYFRLAEGSNARTGSLPIGSGATTWFHLALPNGTTSATPGSTWGGLSPTELLALVLVVSVAVLGVGAYVVLGRSRRRRVAGPRRDPSGVTGKANEGPEQGLSQRDPDPDHGLAGGDPEAASGPGHPGA